jgi:hypothetical protein
MIIKSWPCFRHLDDVVAMLPELAWAKEIDLRVLGSEVQEMERVRGFTR